MYQQKPNYEKTNDVEEDKKWEYCFLKRRCKEMDLEDMYNLYNYRLCINYLSMFILMHLLLCLCNLLMIIIIPHNRFLYIDILAYALSTPLVWIVLSFNFNETLITRHRWILYLTSAIAVFLIIGIDMSVNAYHFLEDGELLDSFCGIYALYVLYLFLPIPQILWTFILGCTASCFHELYYLGVLDTEQYEITSFIIDLANFICVNLIGAFFRLMREITIRSSFLDRYMYIEENILLRSAKIQEQTLLHSILPARIADTIQKDIKALIEYNLRRTQFREIPKPRMAVFESHSSVSILYADVVNYTYLTTTLNVEELVELLHDLFLRFDVASEQYKVQRIKFLGDCYYCVAGLNDRNEDHAKCCVDLGLRIINEMANVRESRNVNINMRIGVHSGDLVAGVIGSAKFQYDIWSKDVDIANRLESTGMPGRVHISNQTIEFLTDDYDYEAGTEAALKNAMLQYWNIRTYLIKYLLPEAEESHYWLHSQTRASSMALEINRPETLSHINLKSTTRSELLSEMERMPRGGIIFSKFLTLSRSKERVEETNDHMFSTFWLFFYDSHTQQMYLKRPDNLLKYCLTLVFIVSIFLITIQVLGKSKASFYWLIDLIALTFLISLLIISWYKKFWIMYIAKKNSQRPRKKISRALFNTSEKISESLLIRLIIYVTILILFCLIVLTELMKCDSADYAMALIERRLFDYNDESLCFNPWVLTVSSTLIVGVSFLFTRVPFIFKTVVSIILASIYAILIKYQFDFVFETSPSTSVFLGATYAHLSFMVLTVLCFYLMERQSEFNSKVNFSWKLDLVEKQADAKLTAETINALLFNMLPAHVVDLYLTARSREQLYYEEYEKVAVMFASIINFDMTKVGLRVLNEIICEFDEVLNFYRFNYKVEKIKVVGWTYMAACGLDIKRSRQNSDNTQSSLKTESIGNLNQLSQAEVERAQDDGTMVVLVLAQFALDLMRTLYTFNNTNSLLGNSDIAEFGYMRIGISFGHIMAGIVGLSTPHYDIWGNPVNMASRMDTTGEIGRMQVTEETADILKNFKIKCTYRGLTYVKGRGEIPTYYVGIDESLNFEHI